MLVSLAVLTVAAAVQVAIFAVGDSVALLADLIHNFGDALTAIPLGIAFWVRSEGGAVAGYFVVLVIFVSACVALYETIVRLIHPEMAPICGRWRQRASLVSSATRSPPGCDYERATGSIARHWSPTATTPAPTDSSPSESSPAQHLLRSEQSLPIR